MAKKKLSPLEMKMKKMAVVALATFATKAEAGANYASTGTCESIIDELV